MSDEHTLEGKWIACGKFFGKVRNGVCSECHKRVRIVTEDIEEGKSDG
jgi:hypothetical protein